MEKYLKLVTISIVVVTHFQLSFASAFDNNNRKLKRTEKVWEMKKQVNDNVIVVESRAEDKNSIERTLLDSKDFSEPEKELWRKANSGKVKAIQDRFVAAQKDVAQAIDTPVTLQESLDPK